MPVFYIYLIVAVCLIAASIPVVIIGKQRRKKQIEEVFGDRQELSERDFYEKYFAEKGVPFFVVEKIRKILEEVFDADLSRLSAEDDFSKNLNFFWHEEADVEIFERVEEEFEIKLQQSDFENLNSMSVNDIVDIIWRKLREKDEFQNSTS